LRSWRKYGQSDPAIAVREEVTGVFPAFGGEPVSSQSSGSPMSRRPAVATPPSSKRPSRRRRNRDPLPPTCVWGKIVTVPVSKKVPVAWVYLTAWMMRDGTVQFRDDVYDEDNDPISLTPEEVARVAEARGGFVPPRIIQNVRQASHLDSR
jgi:hypothetical protein